MDAAQEQRQYGNQAVVPGRLPAADLAGFIGASPGMARIYTAIEAVAASTATVFITGESGTGKEVAAQAIHKSSPRRAKPLVAINCGAIPKDLIESELFGHLKGSFTGAVSDRTGAVKHAHGGTLFLDEVCEMHIDLQSKLLRFLNSGAFTPVGSNKVEQADIRLICATNRDPLAEVRGGRLREDLYYRLHVVPIQMPPLRERGSDILLIAKELLARHAAREAKRFWKFDEAAKARLLAYAWPGNVRQLQNVIQNAVLMNDGAEISDAMVLAALGPEAAIPATATPVRPSPHSGLTEPSATDPGAWTFPHDILPLAAVERAAILRAIALCDGHVTRAAALLGLSASTVYRKKQEWDAGKA